MFTFLRREKKRKKINFLAPNCQTQNFSLFLTYAGFYLWPMYITAFRLTSRCFLYSKNGRKKEKKLIRVPFEMRFYFIFFLFFLSIGDNLYTTVHSRIHSLQALEDEIEINRQRVQ
jgi:hypothetical protein